MNIQIIGDQVELNDSIRKIVNDKLIKKIERYLKHFAEDMKDATLRISERSRWGFDVNFDMWLPGKKHIFAKTKNNILSTAIIDLSREVERQIHDFKDILTDKTKRVSPAILSNRF